jgi:hypothetical protein
VKARRKDAVLEVMQLDESAAAAVRMIYAGVNAMPGGWLVRELKGGAIYYDPVSFNLLFDLEHE